MCSWAKMHTAPLLERRGANRSDQHYLPSTHTAVALLGREAVATIRHAMDDANRRWWRLDIDSYQYKVLRYRPGHYAPVHTDMFPGSMRRKLTLVVQLSEPDAYDGGDLEVQGYGDQWHQVPRGAGVAAVFPAWARHRVSPIERGERWTLAAWGYGPPVR
jgi:PKHD-type hydroxylase